MAVTYVIIAFTDSVDAFVYVIVFSDNIFSDVVKALQWAYVWF